MWAFFLPASLRSFIFDLWKVFPGSVAKKERRMKKSQSDSSQRANKWDVWPNLFSSRKRTTKDLRPPSEWYNCPLKGSVYFWAFLGQIAKCYFTFSQIRSGDHVLYSPSPLNRLPSIGIQPHWFFGPWRNNEFCFGPFNLNLYHYAL